MLKHIMKFQPGWWVVHVAAIAFTLWLGSISFALYLVHRNLAYFWLEDLAAAELGGFVSITLVTCTALGIAWGVTELVEKPSLKFLRGLQRTRSG